MSKKTRKFEIRFIVEVDADQLVNDEVSAATDVAGLVAKIWDGEETRDVNYFVDSYNFDAEAI